MLRDLSCPKCGAPVTLESVDQKIVVCSFCNASSVVEIDAQKEPQLKLERSDKDSAPAVSGTSLWKDAWRRLLKNKLAVFGMIVLGLMIVLVAVGPVIL